MNRFVVLLAEGYDMYHPTVPHCVETALSKEGLLADCRRIFDVLEKTERMFGGSLRLADTNLLLDYRDVAANAPARPDPYDGPLWVFQPPDILTVDEWFAGYAGKRFNEEV